MTTTKFARAGRALLIAMVTVAGISMAPASAHAAGSCTSITVGYSQYYDYAWITDDNSDCAWTEVRHYYYPSGPGVWTAWHGGALYHYETPQEPQMTDVQWGWSTGSDSESGIPA